MSELEAAVAAGVLGAEEGYRSLLQSTVEVARAIFRAKAASILAIHSLSWRWAWRDNPHHAACGVTVCKPLAPLDRLWCTAGLLRWSRFGLAET